MNPLADPNQDSKTPPPSGTNLVSLQFIAPAIAVAGLLLLTAGWWFTLPTVCKVGAAAVVLGCIAALAIREWSGYRFTLWILIANITAMIMPQWFQSIGSFSLTDSWLLLIVVQAIMFGMGTQMSVRDFAQVAKMPTGVVVGLSCQFLIMPLLGWSLSLLFRLPNEIAVGVILVGSCSSGLASNVMTFMAKGNLALSVTMTAMATAMAPIMTPLWMKILAGSMTQVDAFQMSLDIIKMVLVPILAAFVHDWLSSTNPITKRRLNVLILLSVGWLLFLVAGGWQLLAGRVTPEDKRLVSLLSLPGFFAAAFVVGAIYHYLALRSPGIERWMPVLSMFGIVYFTLVTTAKGRDQLLEVGFVLVLVATLHNVLGYFFGYWGSRALGMNRQDARTIAIEVGTQNGAMATGLARSMGKLETVGLAALIFAPLMNVTGSLLANYWRHRPLEEPDNPSL